MAKRNIIVIGASSGGFDAIRTLMSALPEGLDASIFMVWHMAPDVRGVLPQVLNRDQKMFAANAIDHEPINGGRIYVAPPDHHLLIDKGKVRVTKGPKENRFRPAIDPLFRSAALAYGQRVIGIILSGSLDDGTAGLWTIKEHGGMAIAQDPNEAEVSSMPENAIKGGAVDHILPLKEIAALIATAVNDEVPEINGIEMEQDKRTRAEIGIAMEGDPLKTVIFNFAPPSPYTCPECHGVLAAISEGDRVRFRCHTGHAFSADSLLAAITEKIEESMWSAIRNIQESVLLLNHMGDHFAEANNTRLAAQYFRKAKEADERAAIVRQAVNSHEQLSVESLALGDADSQ
jgi:two-component system chemotaxis response regulator CheB